MTGHVGALALTVLMFAAVGPVLYSLLTTRDDDVSEAPSLPQDTPFRLVDPRGGSGTIGPSAPDCASLTGAPGPLRVPYDWQKEGWA
jgi:hypothetical protein